MVDREEAQQFALILSSGVPQIEAMRYMRPDMDNAELKNELALWLKAEAVQTAILRLQGGSWEDMSIEEKIKFSIDKHYTELAYFLYSHNYSELEGANRTKADTCRQVLEAKLAGVSGKMNSLESFLADVNSGKVGLNIKQAPLKGAPLSTPLRIES